MKKKLWYLITGLCIGLYPYLSHLAFLERGYKAYGGEMGVVFIPVLLWLVFGKEEVTE